MAKLSLCMITKNEVKWLDKCLSSCNPFVDEIIIIDTGSKDKTKDIASKYGAKIFNFKWNDDFSAARNESLKHASSDWIIYIDADEIISPKDWEHIRELIEIKAVDAYLFYQRNYTLDKTVFGWQPNDDYKECKADGFFISPITRLFRNKGYSFIYKVHETVDKSILATKGVIHNSKIPIHHYGYLKDSEFINKKRDKYLKMGLEQIKKTPSNPRPYYEVAMVYKNTGKYDLAEEHLKKVIELDPNYKLVFTNLAEVYSKQGKLKEALNAYKESITRKNDENAYINLGMIYFRSGNFIEAVKFIQKAIEINPRNPIAYNNLGLILIKTKKYRAALSIFEKAFEKTGLDKFKEALEAMQKRFAGPLMIEKLIKEKKYAELESYLLARINKNPKDIIAYTHLGNLFIKLNKKKNAVKLLQEAIKHNKSSGTLCINLYVNLANLLIELKKFEKAEDVVKAGLAIVPNDEFLQNKLEFVRESL